MDIVQDGKIDSKDWNKYFSDNREHELMNHLVKLLIYNDYSQADPIINSILREASPEQLKRAGSVLSSMMEKLPDNQAFKRPVFQTLINKLSSGEAAIGIPDTARQGSDSKTAQQRDQRLGMGNRAESATIMAGTTPTKNNPAAVYGSALFDLSVANSFSAIGQVNAIGKPDSTKDGFKIEVPMLNLGYILNKKPNSKNQVLEVQGTIGVSSSKNAAQDTFIRGSINEFGVENPIRTALSNNYIGTAGGNIKISKKDLVTRLNLEAFTDSKIVGSKGDISASTARWIKIPGTDIYIDGHLQGSGSAHKESFDPVTGALSNVYNLGVNGKLVGMAFGGKVLITGEAILVQEVIGNSSNTTADGSKKTNFGLRAKAELELGKLFGESSLEGTSLIFSFTRLNQNFEPNTKIPGVNDFKGDSNYYLVGAKKKFDEGYEIGLNVYYSDTSSRYVDPKASGTLNNFKNAESRTPDTGFNLYFSTNFNLTE